MKRALVVAASLILLWVRANAGILALNEQPNMIETNFSTNSETEMVLNISDLQSSEKSDGFEVELPEYFKIGGGSISGPNQTVLPTYSALLVIPENAELSVTIETDEFTEIQNFRLASATDEENEWIRPMQLGGPVFPDRIVKFEYAGKMRDLHLARLTVYPVQYDYSAKTLTVHHRLVIHANHSGGDILPADGTLSEAFYPIYNSLLSNRSLIEDVQLRRGAYWFIAPQTYVPGIASLVEWKNAMGFDVRVIPTSEIGSNPYYYTIMNFIRNQFNAAEIKPDYICLVGDVSTSTGVDTYSQGNPYGFGYIDSDNYFTFIEGDDYFPELFIGRISISNSSELTNYLNKYFGYARNPYMSDTGWYLNATMVAGSNYPTPRLTKLWCREMLMKYGYTDVDTFLTGYDSPTVINNSINSGVTFVNYRGYGMPEGWTSPYYTGGNVSQLTNGPRFGVMTSIVCGTGDYNDSYTVCLGEAWIRYNNKGGPGFIGTTNPDSHTQWNNAIDCGIYWGLMEEDTYGLAQCQLAGKMAMYYAFPEAIYPGGQVEWYFHSYNVLGDPELQCWTGIPKQMQITHIDSIAVGGAGVSVQVNNQYGQPIDDAYVCLWKDGDVFQGDFTNSDGQIGFQIDCASAGSVHLTVTKPNYIPYENDIEAYSAAVALSICGFMVDDDNSGNSSGNGDTNTNPAEIIELTTMLKNIGVSETAASINSILTSDDAYVNITSGNSGYDDIAPGDSAGSLQPYLIEIASTAPDGHSARLSLQVTAGGGDSWVSIIFLPVSAAMFTDISGSIQADDNGNGILDRGESGELILELQNSGSLASNATNAILRTADTLVQITDSTAVFGDISIDAGGDNSTDPFALSLDAAAYNGHHIDFSVEFSNASGQTQIIEYIHLVGTVTADDPMGPDSHGYYCFDNTDLDYLYHPEYQWIPIETAWLSVYLYDDAIQTRSLPFIVTHYGEAYNEFSISDNGYITLGRSWWSNFLNTNIPSPQSAPAMIAPFWDDLDGPFYVRYNYNEAEGKFVIGWNNVRSNDSYGYQTFEIIILDTDQWPTSTEDNEIIFQYNLVTSPYSASVGMCNYSRDDGFQYVFNSDYSPGAATLISGRAIKFTTGSEYMTDIDHPADNNLPAKFDLAQNYPNPFNLTTNICYQLPTDSDVRLEIYDILGRKVQTLVNKYQPAGNWTYSWDSKDASGQLVSAGLYFYKLTAGNEQLIKKMILLK